MTLPSHQNDDGHVVTVVCLWPTAGFLQVALQNISIPLLCSVCNNVTTGHLNITQVLTSVSTIHGFHMFRHLQVILSISTHTVTRYAIIQQNFMIKKQSLVCPITGPEGSRRLKLPDFETLYTWRWFVSTTHRPPLPPRKYSWYSFLLEAESTPGP